MLFGIKYCLLVGVMKTTEACCFSKQLQSIVVLYQAQRNTSLCWKCNCIDMSVAFDLVGMDWNDIHNVRILLHPREFFVWHVFPEHARNHELWRNVCQFCTVFSTFPIVTWMLISFWQSAYDFFWLFCEIDQWLRFLF